MTRIVAGTARGRRLEVPPKGTRPTSDRAREAMFNSLRSMIDLRGAQVLDLFAGSGAVGLEALSRGAGAAWLVESDRHACAVLRRNVATLALPGAHVAARPVAAFLAGEAQPQQFVFADPPYALDDGELATVLSRLAAGWLAPGAVVVIERDARGTEPRWPDGVTPVMNRRYGAGVLWYGRAQ